MTTHKLSTYFCSAVAFSAAAATALGQATWDGSEPDDLWFTAANWDTGVVPNGATDQAIVGAPSPTLTNGAVLLQSLSVTADGVLSIGVSQDFNFAPGAVTSLTNAGLITALNNSDLQLLGMVNNSGAINLASTGNQTDLEVAVGGATLTGGGTVTFSGPVAGINDASGTQTLTILDQTLQGAGNIGRNTTNFDLMAGNLIDANVSTETLVIDAATLFTNAGTLRASGGGILELRDGGAGDFVNAGGVIEALAGSEVRLVSGARIVGGTLRSVGTGTVTSVLSSNVEFDNLTFDGSFISGNNSDTRILGTINNTGNININSTGNQTDLEIGVGGATLTGGGTVTFSGPVAGINDASGTQTLTIANQTLQGAGDIGRNTTNFDLQAGNLIHANVNTETLIINTADLFTNNGTLRASNGGILELHDGGAGDFANAGGIIEALAGSEVRLVSGARIVGGTLRSVGTGTVTSVISSNVAFENLTFDGTFTSGNNSDTSILGTINNTGNINIASTGNQTDLEVALGGATLTGGGTVTFSGPLAGINDASGTQTLTILNQTLQGAGNIGRNTTDFDLMAGNLIDANVSTETLIIDAANVFTNAGTLRASNGGILELRDGGVGDFVNAGGVIEALAGSEVRLVSGARIVGGTLRSVGTGTVTSVLSSNVEFDNLTFDGSFISGNNSDTRILGTINNTGNININSTGNQTDLEIGVGGATLTGGGTVTFSGPFAGINNASGTQTLTIANQTLQGNGNIGRNSMNLVNTAGGTILANTPGSPLIIDLAAPDFNNDGTLAVDDAELQIVGNLLSSDTATLTGDGTITATGGSITHDGLISPGTSPGTLMLDADVALGTTAEIFIELAGNTPGSDFDLLDIDGTLVLDGELTLALLGGFQPSALDTFEVVTTNGLTGTFTNVADGGTLLTDDGLGSFTVNYGAGSAFDPDSVVLTNFLVVPEPGSAALLGLGGLALLRRRR